MANISSASGKITLKGNWTQEAIDAFEPVLELWGFYGEYGIQNCGGFDEEHLTADFFGCGRWSFSGTLDSFEDWTRQWFKDNPQRPNGEPICTTTEEQYEYFLKIMSENNLIIEIDFEDVEEGCGVHIHEIGEFTSDDGSCISYETISCEDIVPSWDNYERSALDEAIDFFEKFCTDVDRKKLRKWVKKNVFPTDIFESTDDEEIIQYFCDYGEDPFGRFFFEFSPDTEEWKDFDGLYEDMYGNTIEETMEECEDYGEYDEDYDNDDEDDEEDEEEDEDVNDWDTEPNYPTEDIDGLDFTGKAFVLTGDFQNCDGDRKAVEKLIIAKGGRCTSAVSGKTNYLVLGDFGSAGAKKVEKALEEKEKGKGIQIITEYDLFRFL